LSKLKFYPQLESMDCGPACLQMISAYYGKEYSLEFMRELSGLSKIGTNFETLKHAAQQIGLNSTAVKIPFKSTSKDIPGLDEAPLPCIVYWNQKHFVVVYKIDENYVYIADPADKKRKLDKSFFFSSWHGGDHSSDEGYGLLLFPDESFGQVEEGERVKRKSLGFILQYVKPYKRLMFQVVVGLVLVSLLQLIYPFLTQAIIDVGINKRDFNFVILILIGQLSIFLGRTTIEVIRSWILLHVGTRLNISILTDFLAKLMRLPIRFFDSHMVGDIFQRVNEVKRIESILTGQSFNALFSIFTLIIFGVVLFIYDHMIFYIFAFSSIIYTLWVLLFLEKRKKIDYELFSQYSMQQSNLLEVVQGMPEIKLQNCEQKKVDEWEDVQLGLFKIQMKSLAVDQWQRTGARVINELKDIIITIVAAKAVIDGRISLGMMLAIQYIIGNLNAPLMGIVEFVQSVQKASISLDRFVDIFKKEDEEKENSLTGVDISKGDISIENVNFSYEVTGDPVLKNISVNIPRGKVTAIVGSSGSGKTTLLKLLLKFYKPQEGRIKIGEYDLEDLNHNYWRSHCGAVLQDGFIFSESLKYNIGLSDDVINTEKIEKAINMANIYDYIDDLPMGLDTKIGHEGKGLSQGQKQRRMIARSVYKNPDILFFDEATNALDATNERQIMDKLNDFYQGKTVVVVAHRLSTVKNADQILVLEQGEIKELGTHEDLTKKRGLYFNLVKDQLELGN